MIAKNLQEILDQVGNPVEWMRKSQTGAYVYPVVPTEFTNWRRETRAWRETATMLDLTFHMHNLYISGPDALRLFADTAVNSFAKFPVDMAKHFVPVTPAGHVIGDGILFHLADEEYVFVGRAPVTSWLQFRVETGGYNVDLRLDPRAPARPYGKAVTRSVFRFQIQGPNAWAIIEKLNGGPLNPLNFFRMSTMQVAGTTVRTLRHGMAGEPGLELFGPYELHSKVRDAVLEAGAEYGIEPCGARAYPGTTLESGWIPSPLPAIYTGEVLRPYREWLTVESFEANNSMSGSYVSDNVEDYYNNPWELGYGSYVKFDHDFVGRDALESIDPRAQRRKVTLEWNADDLGEVLASSLEDAPGKLFFDMPSFNYAASNFDRVIDADGALVGLSMFSGYAANERKGLSLATVDPNVPIGAEVRVVWGEPNGGTAKPTVEPHTQTEIRAIVCPAPYAKVVREEYRTGWRVS